MKRLRHISEEEFAMMKQMVQGGVGGGAIERDSPRKRNGPKPVDNPAPAPLILTLTIHGQVPSGKNQVQLLWRNGKVHKYPNKTYANWRAAAHSEILAQTLHHEPIATPVRLTVDYTPGDERTRDMSGQMDALFHLLVYSKILKDDGLVHHLGGWTRRAVNRKCPSVLMMIEEVRPCA